MDYFERSDVFVVAVEKELLTGDQIFFFCVFIFCDLIFLQLSYFQKTVRNLKVFTEVPAHKNKYFTLLFQSWYNCFQAILYCS